MRLWRRLRRELSRRHEPVPAYWRREAKSPKHAPAQMRRFRYLLITTILLQATFVAVQLHLVPGPLG